MTQPFDEAYVEIKPDVDGFVSDAQRELNRAFKDIERSLEKTADKLDESFDKVADDIETMVDKVVIDFSQSGATISKEARTVGNNIDAAFDNGARGAARAVDDMADSIERDLDRISRKVKETDTTLKTSNDNDSGGSTGGRERDSKGRFVKGAGDGVEAVGSGITGLLQKFGDLSRNLTELGAGAFTPSGLAAIAAQAAAMAAIIPAVVGLTGAILDLGGALGLLPGLVGVGAATLVTLKLGFKGVEDAVGALMEGDLESFNEALKGMTPSAQKFLRELQGFTPQFSKLQQLAQEGIFKELVGSLNILKNGDFFSGIGAGIQTLSTSIGGLMREFVAVLTNSDVVEAFGDAFESAGRIIDGLKGPLSSVFGTFIGAMEASLPFVEQVFTNIGVQVQKFSDYLSAAVSSGEFASWIQTALGLMGDLWNLGVSVGELFLAIFGNTGDEGKTFIQDITTSVQKLTEFFQSAEGQEYIDKLVDNLETLGNTLIWLADHADEVITFLNDFKDGAQAVGDFLAGLPGVIGGFFSGLWTSIATGSTQIWETVKSSISGVWSSITGFFTGVWNSIVGFFSGVGSSTTSFFSNVYNTIVAFFTALPGQVSSFIMNTINTVVAFVSSLPERLIALATAAFNAFFYNLGYMVGTLVVIFRELPPKVAAEFARVWEAAKAATSAGVSALWNFLTVTIPQIFASVMSAMQAGLTRAWSWLTSDLPRIVQSAMSALWSWLSSTVASMWADLVSRFQSGVASAVSWVNNLPGQVRSAINSTWEGAKSLTIAGVNALIDQARSMVDRVSAYARSLPGVVRAALSGLASMGYSIGSDMINGMINGIRDAAGRLVSTAKAAVSNALQGARDALLSKSPSRRWKYLGEDSMEGYNQGVDEKKKDVLRTVQSAVQLPMDRFSAGMRTRENASTSSVIGNAEFKPTVLVTIGNRFIDAEMVRVLNDNPQHVARAAMNGQTQMARRS